MVPSDYGRNWASVLERLPARSDLFLIQQHTPAQQYPRPTAPVPYSIDVARDTYNSNSINTQPLHQRSIPQANRPITQSIPSTIRFIPRLPPRLIRNPQNLRAVSRALIHEIRALDDE